MLFAMALKWLGGTSSVNNEPISGSPETPLKLWCFGPGDEDAFRLPGFTPLASAFDPMDFATTINKLPEFLPPHSLPGGATSRDLLLNLVELSSSVNRSIGSSDHQLLERLPCSSRNYQLQIGNNATALNSLWARTCYISACNFVACLAMSQTSSRCTE